MGSDNPSFKRHRLKPAERLWLTEAAKPGFDPGKVKVRLRGKLPREFSPDEFDPRIYFGDQITPVGLWLVDRQHPLLDAIDRTIRAIRNRIVDERSVASLSAEEVANQANLSEEVVSHVFYVIANLDNFWNSAQGGGQSHTSIQITDHRLFDKYIHYRNIEELLQEFYQRRGKALRLAIAYSNRLESGSKTRVERWLEKVKNNRVLSFVIVLGICIIAIANFAESIRKVISILAP